MEQINVTTEAPSDGELRITTTRRLELRHNRRLTLEDVKAFVRVAHENGFSDDDDFNVFIDRAEVYKVTVDAKISLKG